MAGIEGKLCVITGATSGIGLIAAERLARQGARLVLVGRDPARGEAALARIKARAPRAEASVHYADLSRLDGRRPLAAGPQAPPRVGAVGNNPRRTIWPRPVPPDAPPAAGAPD